MTIYLYSGTPGSGKSLHAAQDMSDYLRCKKLPVVGNFDLNPDTKGYERFTYCGNADMTPSYLVDFAARYWRDHRFREDNILLVLDECQILFNSRDWNSKGSDGKDNARQDWLKFFSQHRKYGYKIIFIAQFDRMIDRQIRALVEYEFKHRKLGNFGWKGKVMTFFTMGELFCCFQEFYGNHERIGSSFMRARKSLYRMYDSYATFERADCAAEG